jgi:F-type H+-transporting ATPase subunit b
VLKVLEERRQKIAEGLANADKIKQELATAQTKAQEILNQANTQGNRLIEEARQSAARVLEQETQKAVKAAQDLVAKAEQSNKAELERLRTDLMRHIGRLVADTTAKVVNKTLSPDDKQRLIEEANSQLNPSVPAS